MSGAAYYLSTGWVRGIDEPPCTWQGETWARHTWTPTDPHLPAYQDCSRCGLRRLLIAEAIAGRQLRDRRGVTNAGGLGNL